MKENPPPPAPSSSEINSSNGSNASCDIDTLEQQAGNNSEDEDDDDDENAENDRSSFLGYEYPSDDEINGKATRTEIYWCEQCGAFTRFPRYNSASYIVDKSRGRCGEYSMLLFRMLRSMGYESRWVIDWADHVWAEVKIGGRWVHADPCEAALDKPLLYQEWGKQQNYIIAFNAPPLEFFNPERQTKTPYKSTVANISSIWNKCAPLVEDVTTTYTSDSINDIQSRREESSSIIKSSLMEVEKSLQVKLSALRESRMK